MFYLHFRGPGDAVAPKTAMSAADAIRQRAEWEARGFEVEVRDPEGKILTIQQLQNVPEIS
jgi:hypothetical protein